MANPTVESTSTGRHAAAGDRSISYPGTMTTGATVLCIYSTDGPSETITWPTGGDLFTEIRYLTEGGITFVIAWHKVTGSEGATFTVNAGSNESGYWICASILGAQDPDSMPPEASTGAVHTATATPDPDSITAGTTGYENLFVACMGCDRKDITQYPTNCPDNNIDASGAATPGPGDSNAGMATAALDQDTFNPDAFTIAGADGWCACTVVFYGDFIPVPILMTASIADDDTITGQKLDSLAKIETAYNAILDRDYIIGPTAVLSLYKKMSASLTDTDTVTADLVISLGIVLMSASITDDDSLTQVDLTRFMKIAASLTEDDAITQATLDSLAKLTASLADDDSLTQVALRIFMKMAASVTEDDTITAAKLDALAKIAASLTEDDTITAAGLTLTAALSASITDTDTITAADLIIVVAVVLMTASLTDEDSVSGADLTRYMLMAASLVDDDSLSQAHLGALVKISASLADDDAITGADMIRLMKMAASLTEEDLITAADLIGPTKMTASIVEWDTALGGSGGPTSGGIIMG